MYYVAQAMGLLTTLLCIIGSTTMFAQVVSIVNNTAAWILYHRKRKKG